MNSASVFKARDRVMKVNYTYQRLQTVSLIIYDVLAQNSWCGGW